MSAPATTKILATPMAEEEKEEEEEEAEGNKIVKSSVNRDISPTGKEVSMVGRIINCIYYLLEN